MDDSILTGAMSTTQMRSKTRRVDSYDVMVEAEKKMNAFDACYARYKAKKALQAAVEAEDDAYDDEEDATRRDAAASTTQTRRDAFDACYARYKAKKALQAAVEAEDDAYDDEEDATRRDAAASITQTRRDAFDACYARYKAKKALQAAVEAEDDAYDDEEDATRRDAAAASQIAVKVNKHDRDAYDEFKALRAEYYAIRRQLAAVKADAAASQVAVKADAVALQVRQHNISELVRRGPTKYLKLARRVQGDVLHARYDAREASKAAVKADAAASQAAVKADAAALQVHRDTLAALVGEGQTKYVYRYTTRASIDKSTDVEIDAMYTRYELSMALWERRSAWAYT